MLPPSRVQVRASATVAPTSPNRLAQLAQSVLGRPTFPGQVGHPESGHSLSVTQTAVVTGGFTGSLANSIVVTFPGQITTSGITLTFYDTPAPIPTSFLLPCSGTGQVRYDPEPTSPTAGATVPPRSAVPDAFPSRPRTVYSRIQQVPA